MSNPSVIVKYQDETQTIECPYGNTTRIVTNGEGGIANVHIIKVSAEDTHYHTGYNEVYYVLSGTGTITIDEKKYELRAGAVVVIPAGINHSVKANDTLEFIIFGTPAMSVNDERFIPMRK